jgi:hypothetical protein
VTGLPTGGKPINLGQLREECAAAGADMGMGQHGDMVFTYADGQPADFPPDQTPIVQQCLDWHIAMRDRSDAEYSAEFQASSDPARKQDIRDIMAGLMPREQVPM